VRRVGVGLFDSVDVAPALSQKVAAEYELFPEAYQRLEPWFDKVVMSALQKVRV
jgi:hypothetical protein